MTKLKDKYTKFYLDNGIKCILYKRQEVHSIHIQVKVRVASLDEEVNNSGISHFIEHLAFDGTKNLPTWKDINDYQNNISGSCNAFTSMENTTYHGSFPSKYLKDALFYYSELVFNPLHKLEDIEKERTIIQDERKRYEDEIDYHEYKNIIDTRYLEDNTAFKRQTIGTKDTINSINKNDIDSFFTKYYVPENIEIYISGNILIDEAKKYVNQYFNKTVSKRKRVSEILKQRRSRDFVVNPPTYTSFKISNKLKKDVKQLYLDITFPSIQMIGSDIRTRYIVDFLSAITASSRYQNSILNKRLREELALVYNVSANDHDYLSRCFFNISTQFDIKYLEKVLKEVYEGLELIKSGKYGLDIFNQRKTVLEDTHLLRYDSPSNVLSWIMDQEYELEFNNKSISYSEYLNLNQSIKFEEVVDIAKRIFNWNYANINLLSEDKISDIENIVKTIIKN